MRLFDSPRDRAKEVTLGLATSPALSHVLLGAFLASAIQYVVPSAAWAVGLAGLLWIISVVVYAVAEGVVARLEEEKNRLLDPQSEYRGIE